MWISSLLVAIPLRVSEWGSEIYFGQFVFGIALLVYIINRIHWCAALHYAAFVDSGRDSRRESAIDLLLTVAMLMTHDRAHVSPAVINAKTRCLSRITIFFIHHLHLTSPLILIVLSSLDTGIQSTMEMLPFKRGCCNCSPCPPPHLADCVMTCNLHLSFYSGSCMCYMWEWFWVTGWCYSNSLWCICVVDSRCSLFVLKVPLNSNQSCVADTRLRLYVWQMVEFVSCRRHWWLPWGLKHWTLMPVTWTVAKHSLALLPS